jgi:hypothetical protein
MVSAKSQAQRRSSPGKSILRPSNMEKQEFKSKWDELARDLGAEIPPETLEREQARSVSTTDTVEPTTADMAPTASTVSRPLPKRSSADWDKLAGDLGLPPLEPAASLREAPSEERQPAAPPPEISRKPTAERPPREPRQHPQRREPREKQSESSGNRRQPSGRNRESARRSDETSRTERAAAAEHEVPTPPAEKREDPAKPAAVSLWHKIFGSPTEQSATLSDMPSTPSKPKERFETRDEPVEISVDEIRSLSGADVTAAPAVEELDHDEATKPSEDAEASASMDQRRGRVRRRRRGGRGRGSEQGEGRRREKREIETSRDTPESDDDFDDLRLDDSAADDLDSDTLADKLAADEYSDGEDVGATDADRSKAAQRAIPSWDEAIGFIVDSNMQSRSQRRPPSRSPSRGGSTRGRTRGRRKS